VEIIVEYNSYLVVR